MKLLTSTLVTLFTILAITFSTTAKAIVPKNGINMANRIMPKDTPIATSGTADFDITRASDDPWPSSDGRFIAFWQFNGDICGDTGYWFFQPGGNFGDARVEGCLPLLSNTTLMYVAEAPGCQTTILHMGEGGCTVPINFDSSLELGVCRNFDQPGLEDLNIWYRCEAS